VAWGDLNANPFKMREHSWPALLEMVAKYVRDHERGILVNDGAA
jgi:hypothetical protein